MKAGVYGIRNCLTGKFYVGSAVLVSRRLATHRTNLRGGRHHSRKLQDSWNLHGTDAFEFFLIEAIEDIRDLLKAEQFWIDHYDSFRHGYNANPIADLPPSHKGVKRSAETRARMKAAQQRQAAEISALHKGRVKSPEECENIRKSHLGHKHSDETKARIGIKSQNRSPETLAKMSESAKRRGMNKGMRGYKPANILPV